MSNSNVEKSVPASETSEKITQRRNFLKWGVLGVLVAGPFGVVAWKHSQKNKYKYSYTLNGPFQFPGGDGPFPKGYVHFSGDTGFARYEDSSRWSGNTNNKFYTPEWVILQRTGPDDNPDVTFTIRFNVLKRAPENLLAVVKVSLCSGGQEFTVREHKWGAPHKQPPVGERFAQEYSLITIPLADLDRIDKIVVEIDEIIRS